MIKFCKAWGVALALACVAVPAQAKTLYVTDELSVNLRSAPKGDAEGVKLLKSNTAMELLGDEGDYYKVRLGDGVEGYFPKRYATGEEPRTVVIGRLEKQIAKLQGDLEAARQRLGSASGELESERQQLVEQLQATQGEVSALQQEIESLQNERDAALQKYERLAADAGNVVELARERDELAAQAAKLRSDLDAANKENESLLISGIIKWFIAGAGVLFFGWLMGRSSRRKRGGLSGY